ncbi:hypothetical protein ACIQYZ_13575 [Rhodococcus erythropolis]
MSNRKQRRAEARDTLNPAAFRRELDKVLAGDPSADRMVAAFWDDARGVLGVEVAVPHRDGVEVLRRVGGQR